MTFDNLKYRYFGSGTTANLDDNGYWHVTVEILEKYTDNDGNNREEKLSASAVDKTLNTAHALALASAMQEMDELVYSKGYESLIEGIDKRALEGRDDSETKVDTSLPA